MPTRVFRLKCLHPSHAEAAVIDGWCRQAHQYYNRLIDVENEYRTCVEKAMQDHYPDYAAALRQEADIQARLDAAIAILNKNKSDKRTREIDEDSAAAVRDIREEFKPVWEELKKQRKAIYACPAWKEANKKLMDHVYAERKRVYAESSLWWGTKNATAEAVESAVTKQRFGRLRYAQSYGRSKKLYTQIPKGQTWADTISGKSTQLQVIPDPNLKKRCIIRVRHGSVDGRAPRWVEFSARSNWTHDLKRDGLPEHFKIMGVQIIRNRGGRQFCKEYARLIHDGQDHLHVQRDYFEVQLIATTEQDLTKPCGQRTVAVDVGWRMMPDGRLRVAYASGEDGFTAELCIGPERLEEATAFRTFQSQIDIVFTAARDLLSDWFKSLDTLLPLTEKQLENLSTISNWRSPRRLYWAINDVAAFLPEGLLARLREWQASDAEIEARMINTRARFERWRTSLYREFAADLGKRYATIVAEKKFLADAREKPLPEDGAIDAGIVFYRNTAAAAMLLGCLKMQGRAAFVEYDAAYTTADCWSCGERNDLDKKELLHECVACHVTWDQDENAARNLLKRHEEATKNATVAETKEKTKTIRRTRRKAKTEVASETADVPG